MAFDPDVVVMDQVGIQFGQRTLRNAAEEDDQAALADHVDRLRLCGIDRCCGDDLT